MCLPGWIVLDIRPIEMGYSFVKVCRGMKALRLGYMAQAWRLWLFGSETTTMGIYFGWKKGISGERDAMGSLRLSVFGSLPFVVHPFEISLLSFGTNS